VCDVGVACGVTYAPLASCSVWNLSIYLLSVRVWCGGAVVPPSLALPQNSAHTQHTLQLNTQHKHNTTKKAWYMVYGTHYILYTIHARSGIGIRGIRELKLTTSRVLNSFPRVMPHARPRREGRHARVILSLTLLPVPVHGPPVCASVRKLS
jgi:hypothetical protein